MALRLRNDGPEVDTMMRCEEFREKLDGSPGEDFPGRLEHAAECTDCAHYAAEAALFERRLARAIAVDVPEFSIELPEPAVGREEKVVALRRRSGEAGPGRWSLPAWAGAAAMLVLGVAILFRLTDPGLGGVSPSELAHEVIAHMDHEPYSRVVSSTPVPADRLAQVLNPAVSRLDTSGVGLVTYARTCPINGRDIPHLVVQGADGPVTLLLMPEQPLDAPVKLDEAGFHGVMLPVGDGSIAIVGEKGRSVDDVAQGIREAVDWSI